MKLACSGECVMSDGAAAETGENGWSDAEEQASDMAVICMALPNSPLVRSNRGDTLSRCAPHTGQCSSHRPPAS